MGENSITPNDSKPSEEGHNSDAEMLSENEENDLVDDLSPEEFYMINKQLDDLSSALDDIEQKNDNIHAQLLQLLEDNREMRKQIQEYAASSSPQQNEENSEKSS